MQEAEGHVTAWLAQPSAEILDPGERHWDVLRDLMRDGQTSGSLVMDASLAAIAIEHGAALRTTDRNFARFPGLRWDQPARRRLIPPDPEIQVSSRLSSTVAGPRFSSRRKAVERVGQWPSCRRCAHSRHFVSRLLERFRELARR